MSRTTFNSSREAYAYILEEQEKAKELLERTRLDISFLWMNITKGNFEDDSKQEHALKELGDLAKSSYSLADSAARLSNLAKALSAYFADEINGNVD
ncbi:hypothetical protein PC41400_14995 [Paenibacillus chitinolyticus]|uniref:Uncharacterized protein n=1 Tax=Paenibacillus chitinolyticus TaxID=79263 RepID=A0A410WX97_9BACL|nr:hypothetical protein [Paenibacillus chitinolyticus]MCY9592349.1 hypothetical protein [Paenibacillus chitinolyticus]MCY9599810.1 hypothetical protein [Paenibacillus chitinolyticus]QAV18912.1 hypothetical protein PC41400_14995 [Paenibacillus chitinolyticus]